MNPFEGIITPQFKKLHKDMIDALLEDTALTVECTLNYKSTKFEDCLNCLYDNIGGKSSNRYQNGGPVPFYHGICPVCNGQGKKQSSSSENLWLAAIWDSKSWTGLSQEQIKKAEVSVQTMSRIDVYDKLVKCTSIIIESELNKYKTNEFHRVGNPEPCGFGSTHLITSWKQSR